MYIYIYIYIVIYRQTVSLYYNTSVWLDMQDTSSWDRNPPNFTLDLVSYHSAIWATYVSLRIIYLTFHLDRFNMKSFHCAGSTPQSRLIPGCQKKSLIPLAFPLKGCLRYQAIHSVLLSQYCPTRRPLETRWSIYNCPLCMNPKSVLANTRYVYLFFIICILLMVEDGRNLLM